MREDALTLKNRLAEMRKKANLSGQFNPTAKLALVLCIALEVKFEDLFYFD